MRYVLEGSVRKTQDRVRITAQLIDATTELVDSNCLATVNPQLVKEWHPIQNGNLTPQDVTSGSTKKVWWQCKCGYEWQARIDHRTRRGQGCPQCKGKRISQTKRLKRKSNGQLTLFGD